MRRPVKVHVPIRLHAQALANAVVIKTDELAVTNLTVGSNMVTGTATEVGFYQGDTLRHETSPGGSMQSGLADGGYEHTVQRAVWHIPKQGEKSTIVVTLTMFETDVPAQHFWQPGVGKHYKALWEHTFKLPME